MDQILTVQEVADYLKVSRTTVWRWCNDGKLAAVKIGHSWRIQRAEVEKVLVEGLDEGESKPGEVAMVSQNLDSLIIDASSPLMVDWIDLSGYNGAVADEILFRVSDEFEVTEIMVTITTPAGEPIEQGQAIELPNGSRRWVYAAKVMVSSGTTVRFVVKVVCRASDAGVMKWEKVV